MFQCVQLAAYFRLPRLITAQFGTIIKTRTAVGRAGVPGVIQ